MGNYLVGCTSRYGYFNWCKCRIMHSRFPTAGVFSWYLWFLLWRLGCIRENSGTYLPVVLRRMVAHLVRLPIMERPVIQWVIRIMVTSWTALPPVATLAFFRRVTIIAPKIHFSMGALWRTISEGIVSVQKLLMDTNANLKSFSFFMELARMLTVAALQAIIRSNCIWYLNYYSTSPFL